MDETIKALPRVEQKQVLGQVEELRELVFSNPREALPRVEHAIQNYPTVAPFYNFLAAAHRGLGHSSMVESAVVENFKKHPDYLFARLNYAELCIQQGRIEKIPSIFGGVYDLGMLYPSREVFHISEVIAFMGTVGFYFFRINKPSPAEICCDALEQLAPDSPTTERLRNLLGRTKLGRILKRFSSRASE